PNYSITEFQRRLLGRAQYRGDRLGQTLPIGALTFQLPTPGPRETVKFGVAAGFRGLPFGFQPAAGFEAMQRRIERTLLHLQNVLRDLLQPLGDRVAV